MKRFISRIWPSPSSETKLSKVPFGRAADSPSTGVDEQQVTTNIDLHQTPRPEKLGLKEEKKDTESISMPVESCTMLKREMKHEVTDECLNDVPAFMDKVARKAAKKQRKKDAASEKSMRTMKRKSASNGTSTGLRHQRNGSQNAATVAAIIERQQKRKIKKQNRRAAAARQATEAKQRMEAEEPLYAVQYHLWGPECHPDRCADPSWHEGPPDCPDRYEDEIHPEYHGSHHSCTEDLEVKRAPHQHLTYRDEPDLMIEGAVPFSLDAFSHDNWNQTFINFDVGPDHRQVRVHADFLEITYAATEVFKKMFRYAELVPTPIGSDGQSYQTPRRAYRIPESIETFKRFLEHLARDIPQAHALLGLWNADIGRKGELLTFVKKWDLEEFEDELLALREMFKQGNRNYREHAAQESGLPYLPEEGMI